MLPLSSPLITHWHHFSVVTRRKPYCHLKGALFKCSFILLDMHLIDFDRIQDFNDGFKDFHNPFFKTWGILPAFLKSNTKYKLNSKLWKLFWTKSLTMLIFFGLFNRYIVFLGRSFFCKFCNRLNNFFYLNKFHGKWYVFLNHYLYNFENSRLNLILFDYARNLSNIEIGCVITKITVYVEI